MRHRAQTAHITCGRIVVVGCSALVYSPRTHGDGERAELWLEDVIGICRSASCLQ